MCNNQAIRSTILERLLSQCRRVRPPGPYRRLEVQIDCGRTSGDGENILARLGAEFNEEQLEASGVATRGADGRLTLVRPLARPGSILGPLREGEGDAPFEILTPSGPVGREVPVLSTLRDYRTGKWLPKTNRRMLVCASTAQIPAFRSVLLPATTSTGLTALSGDELRELSQRLRWSEPSTPENTASATGPVDLTLVNWHPETLSAEQCMEIRQVAQDLALVERRLHIDMSRCSVWTPSESEVRDIRFCLERADLNAATEAILASADNSSHFVSAYEDPVFQPRREPESVAEALHEIERCERQCDGSPAGEHRRRRAIAICEQRVEEELVGPLEEHVAESEDPLAMNLGMLVAESLRLIYRQAPIRRQCVSKLVQDPSSQSNQKIVMEQLKDQERQIASVARLVKELKR